MQELFFNRTYTWVTIGEDAVVDPSVEFIPYEN